VGAEHVRDDRRAGPGRADDDDRSRQQLVVGRHAILLAPRRRVGLMPVAW
jgi:hypothetical protein